MHGTVALIHIDVIILILRAIHAILAPEIVPDSVGGLSMAIHLTPLYSLDRRNFNVSYHFPHED